MKKLITLVAGLLITGSVFANTITSYGDKKLVSADYSTKSAALNAGYDIAENLITIDQDALHKKLVLKGESSVRNIMVDKTEVRTEEFSLSRDDIQYRAIVKVNYHFDARNKNCR